MTRNPIDLEERVSGTSGALRMLGAVVIMVIAGLTVLVVLGALSVNEFWSWTFKALMLAAIVAAAALALSALNRRP